MCYDAKKHEIRDFEQARILDPAMVVKSSLKYGAGLASMLLTAECAVVEDDYNFVQRVHEEIKL